MSTTPTAAPSRAKRSAPALPIPEAAAVTMPILPSSRMVALLALLASGRDVPALVKRVECGAVGFPDDVPLDLQGGRHLIVGDGKGFRGNHEAPDPLDRRKPLVDPRDDGADCPRKLGIGGLRMKVFGRGVRCIAGRKVGVRHLDGNEIGPAVA